MGCSLGKFSAARMLGILTACVFFAFASVATADPTADIVGGSDADFNDWKFAAAVLNTSDPASQFCGGALIRQQWVLTAKTCVDQAYSPGANYVLVGRSDLFGTGGAVIKVTDSFENPAFDEEWGANNLALLRLESPAPAPAEPIALPGDSDTLPSTGSVDVAGWGDTIGDLTGFPDLLQAVTMDLSPGCTYEDSGYHGPSFCGGVADPSDPGGPRSICFGDEGSPATYDFGAGKRLAGIANWFFECTDETLGSKFVDIASPSSRTWINGTLAAAISFSPKNLDFGNVDLRGGEVTRTITVNNIGDTAFDPGEVRHSGGGRIAGPHYNWTRVTRDGCGSTVPVGGTCSFDLTFTPGVLGQDGGGLWIDRGDIPGTSAVMPFGMNVVGDVRSESFVFSYKKELLRVKGKGKNAGRRYLRMIWTATPNGLPYLNGDRCSGTISLSTKFNGVKRPVNKTSKLLMITQKKFKVCGAYFNVMLPKTKKSKMSKRTSGRFTASFSGNDIMRPSATKESFKLPLRK